MVDQKAIKAARRALGRQLAALRQAAGYNQHEFARQVNVSRSSQANIETGHQKGSRTYWLSCDKLLLTGGQLTTAYDEIEDQVRRQYEEAARAVAQERVHELERTHGRRAGSLRERVTQAADESQRFLDQWETRSLSRETVEEFAEELGWLAREYVYRPIDGVFDDLVTIRDRAYALLNEQRRSGDVRTLLFVAGLAGGMLAHASIDLGDRRAAADQARVAARLAAEAGHHGLLAWIFGTQSLIAYCLRRPERAIEYAERGQRYPDRGTGSVRLAALKTRAYAMRGNVSAAKEAQREAETLAGRGEAHELDSMGGILTFPHAKQAYYAASTGALLADGNMAEVHAQRAIAAYESAPPGERSYGDLALSRITLAQAQLLKPHRAVDPAAAEAALTPVLALPGNERIAGLHRPLRKLQVYLEQGPASGSAVARELHAKVDGFLDDTRAIMPV
ncbi:MAG: helix-turn-helix domain-containing protein [Micromonosporaceae bacterium]